VNYYLVLLNVAK